MVLFSLIIKSKKMILSAKKIARGVRLQTSLLKTIPLRASATQVEVFVDGKSIKVRTKDKH